MASINTNGDRQKKGKPKKMNLRVDFTPMVDMNMLLITFFMFCTTLSIPQVMDIAMPAKSGEDKDPPMTAHSKTITVLLGENNNVYYYKGIPDYEDNDQFKNVDYSELRNVLLNMNNESVVKIKDLKRKLVKKEMSEKNYREQLAEVKKSKEGITVLIKPTREASYKNLVDVLDEMQICGIGRYAIVEIAEGDNYLLDKHRNKENTSPL